MRNKPHRRRTHPGSSGVTLVEVLLVAGLVGIIIVGMAAFFKPMYKFLQRSPVRQQASREARNTVDVIKRVMSNGRISTLTISTPPTSPTIPHSQVTFMGLDGVSYQISWSTSPAQSVHLFKTPSGGPTMDTVLATHVKSLLFTVDLRDPGLVYVTLRTEWPMDVSGDANSFYTTFIDKQVIEMSSS